jgi:hypothetical protein
MAANPTAEVEAPIDEPQGLVVRGRGALPRVLLTGADGRLPRLVSRLLHE